MKKPLLSSAFFFWALLVFAQSPAAFKYAAVALDASGQPMSGAISVRFTLHEDGENGAVRYQEIHENFGVNNGKFNLDVGKGAPTALSGAFSALDWPNHQYWLRVHLALNGSGDFNNFGVSQLLSVPYALYAAQAGGNANDKDEQTLSINDNQISISNGNTVALPVPVEVDGSITNEIQQLSLANGIISLSNGGGSVSLPLGTDAQTLSVSGTQLAISNGNTVTLPAEVDGSVTNEIQQLSLAGGVISLSNGGGSVSLPLGTDTQTLSVSNNQLTISNGNTVTLPASTGAQTLSVSGNQLSISNGNTVPLPAEVDGSVTNEIQQLSLAGGIISLSNGGGSVSLPVGTDTQTLSVNNNQLTISNGNTVTLPASTGAQTLSVSGNQLSISNGNTVPLPAEVDGSVTNEIQQLSLAGGIISLSNGGGSVSLPVGTDAQTLSINGNQLSIANGNTVPLPAEVDGSVTNEIQQLSLAGGIISLSNGGGSVSLPVGTDAQTLSINGNQLSIANGNTVPLPAEVDGSVTNEIQQLSFANGIISLSNGGSVTLPTAGPGIAITNNVITNTAPNQPVNLTGGGGTTIIGTYPNFTITSTDGGGTNVAPGIGIEMEVNGNTTTVSARNRDSIWDASALRGRPIGGMPPSSADAGRMLVYDNDNGMWKADTLKGDFDTQADGNIQVAALRGRPIGGMPPSDGSSSALIYNSTKNQYDYMDPNSDLKGDGSGTLTLASIQGLRVNLDAGIGPDMALTCVTGSAGLEFQCVPANGGGFQLPFEKLNFNANQIMFNLRNLNSSTNIGMQVRHAGRYGIKGIADEGQANFNFSALNTGFTYPAGLFGEHNNSSQAGLGVLGKAVSSGDNNEGIGGLFMGKSAGVFGVCYAGGVGAVVGYSAGGVRAGYFVGDVDITGNISKSSGSFKIDHPQDPENKFLYHSFVESPDMKNIYDGVVMTDGEGYATVELPAYFETLNRDFRYQLTCIGDFAQAIVAKKVEQNRFVVRTDKPNMEVSWQVTGIRKDPWAEQHPIVPEVEKKTNERGRYLHPELYGQPQAKQIGHDLEKP